MDPERLRMEENNPHDPVPAWHKWGPYVSERSWGTVREDYSEDGDSWKYFPHEHARSRIYCWGEDGIAGICDRYQVLALSFAMWNGKDRILKERLFGLAPYEANHGEDVKELYYYLDCTPTHSYMRYLYKYTQKAYPYEDLIQENQKRGLKDPEYELIDTGALDENRYFDVFIEYAKAGPEDMCIKIEIFNRGPESAKIHVLPQLVFRNSWRWHEKLPEVPVISIGKQTDKFCSLQADDSRCEPIKLLNFPYSLGRRTLYGNPGAELLFTDNESNNKKLFNSENATGFTKDAFHRTIVDGENCVNPANVGTKACMHYKDIEIPAGSSHVIRLRLTDQALQNPLEEVDQIVATRKAEADQFYEGVHAKGLNDEEKLIQRQALSGMLWSKQVYMYNVKRWFEGDAIHEDVPKKRKLVRNTHWKHLISKRIISMPDKWEYPWFAAWDLAFHTVTLALVDMDFAKRQLGLLMFDQFQHPNGQIPAYEWEFSDLNPPVQAWAVWRLYKMECEKGGKPDKVFLKRCFHKLIINFAWWVNKVDSKGNNVFEGGFLGLDNITVFDRSAPLPDGGRLEQSDGTGWMGFFCLYLMRMALELSKDDHSYQNLAVKFFEHYVYIASALEFSEERKVQIWDDEDGFFYDVLCIPGKVEEQIKVRSLVGIIPLYAVDVITEEELEELPEFKTSFNWFLKNRLDLTQRCVTPIGRGGKMSYLLGLMHLKQMKRVLKRVWDPKEFRSDYGLRSLSKVYQDNPYELLGNSINYEPGEATALLKGGNSNWRGPVWLPTTFLLIESLKKLSTIAGDDMKMDDTNPKEIADYFAQAVIKLFKKDDSGKRPIYAGNELLQSDPHFQDLILFFEHYHGDTGRGLGASHQTGWSGLVANLLDEQVRSSRREDR